MDEKLTGIVIGALITVGILSVLGFASAHVNDGDADGSGYYPMMGDGYGMMMHHGYDADGTDGFMEGCPMMDGDFHGELDLDGMDQDGDGICDFCGIPVDECLDMHGSGMMGHHMSMMGNWR